VRVLILTLQLLILLVSQLDHPRQGRQLCRLQFPLKHLRYFLHLPPLRHHRLCLLLVPLSDQHLNYLPLHRHHFPHNIQLYSMSAFVSQLLIHHMVITMDYTQYKLAPAMDVLFIKMEIQDMIFIMSHLLLLLTMHGFSKGAKMTICPFMMLKITHGLNTARLMRFPHMVHSRGCSFRLHLYLRNMKKLSLYLNL